MIPHRVLNFNDWHPHRVCTASQFLLEVTNSAPIYSLGQVIGLLNHDSSVLNEGERAKRAASESEQVTTVFLSHIHSIQFNSYSFGSLHSVFKVTVAGTGAGGNGQLRKKCGEICRKINVSMNEESLKKLKAKLDSTYLAENPHLLNVVEEGDWEGEEEGGEEGGEEKQEDNNELWSLRDCANTKEIVRVFKKIVETRF